MSDSIPNQKGSSLWSLMTPDEYHKCMETHTEVGSLVTPPKAKPKPLWTPPKPPADLIKLAPITKEEWNKLDGKARWDSIVALRGPDRKPSTALKHITTAVIRYRLSEVMRVGGQVNGALPFCILPDSNACPTPDSFDWEHFIPHIAEACGWLSIPCASVPAEPWFEAVGKGGWSPLKDLRKHLTGPYVSTADWVLYHGIEGIGL